MWQQVRIWTLLLLLFYFYFF
uniref:Uncharacterized protein n=1 Tax=Anguilla anguilla TaxID=7936 RepID=A0A0E9XPE1_ANGAN